MLGEGEANHMALAVPSECRDRFEFAESFTVTIAGSSWQPAELDLEELVAVVRHRPQGSRLQALRQGRIGMFADTDGAEPISRRVPADHWLTVEVPDGIVHYFNWQGQWYEIGAEYLTVIERRITELLAQPVSVSLPPWTRDEEHEKHDEGWYNRQIAACPADDVAGIRVIGNRIGTTSVGADPSGRRPPCDVALQRHSRPRSRPPTMVLCR